MKQQGTHVRPLRHSEIKVHNLLIFGIVLPCHGRYML